MVAEVKFVNVAPRVFKEAGLPSEHVLVCVAPVVKYDIGWSSWKPVVEHVERCAGAFVALHKEKTPDHSVAAHKKKKPRNKLALIEHHLPAAVLGASCVVLWSHHRPTMATSTSTATATPWKMVFEMQLSGDAWPGHAATVP